MRTVAAAVLMGWAVAVVSAAAVAGPVDSFSGLDAYIERVLPDWQTPGAAVGVIKDGKIIYAKGFGVRQAGFSARVDPQTAFQIASLTKAFTAAAVGRLVDEQVVRWDDRVIDHLPTFRLSDDWVTQHVTVRDMLSNRTGVESGGFSLTLQDSREVFRRGRFAPFNEPFRYYQYSNYMYGVSGQFVHAVTGTRYEDYLKRAIFAPLHMKSSGTSPYEFWDASDVDPCFFCERPEPPRSFEHARISNVAMPHWPTDAGPQVIRWRSMDGVAASGCIVSNLTDMLAWMRFNLAAGAVDGHPVLQPQTVRELHSPQVLKDDSAWGRTVWPAVNRVTPTDAQSAYTLGWFYNTYRGAPYVSHGGGALGMVTFAAMAPSLNTGIVVLTNGNSAELGFLISFRIIDELLRLAAHDWNADLLREAHSSQDQRRAERAKIESQRLSGTSPTLPLSAYAGDYESNIYGPMRIDVEDGQLVFRMRGADAFSRRLEHWHQDVFHLPWWKDSLDAWVAFKLDEQARVTSFDAGAFFGRFDRVPAQ